MVRCFIGILIPPDIVSYVSDLQTKLKKLPIDAKFVELENLHLTLSFLNEISEVDIKKTSHELDNVASKYRKFQIDLKDLELLPNENYVRVISLAVHSDLLENLRKDIAVSIGGDSKPPHLTMCRVRAVENKNLFKQDLRKIELKDFQMEVDEICLFESKLGRTGPAYSKLHGATLY